jgi:hypothetical protein
MPPPLPVKMATGSPPTTPVRGRCGDHKEDQGGESQRIFRKPVELLIASALIG